MAAVATVAELVGALSDSSTSRILLNPGTYALSTGLAISRDILLEAAVRGAVVLDGQDSTQVLFLSVVGTVELIGLNITRGFAHNVSALLVS